MKQFLLRCKRFGECHLLPGSKVRLINNCHGAEKSLSDYHSFIFIIIDYKIINFEWLMKVLGFTFQVTGGQFSAL